MVIASNLNNAWNRAVSAAGINTNDDERSRFSATIPATPTSYVEPRSGQDGVIINLNLKGDRFEPPTKDGIEYAPPTKLMRTIDARKGLTTAQSKKRLTFRPPKTP